MSTPFSIVTGASAGIGLELAAISAPEGFDAGDVAHGGFDTLMRGDGEWPQERTAIGDCQLDTGQRTGGATSADG